MAVAGTAGGGMELAPLVGARRVAAIPSRGGLLMRKSPIAILNDLGQSPWLDFLERDFVRSGRLSQLVQRWGLRGVTSNPAIFARAIEDSEAYDTAIHAMSLRGASALEIYEALALQDVADAADLFRPIHDESRGDDGYVSIEVSPHLAHDTDATVSEARRLWKLLARPNVLIKVPATTAGITAIQRLIGEGINVNVTLLFSIDRYRQVADAYVTGLSAALARGHRLEEIVSVASFFLSRIDVLLDPRLDAIGARGDVHGDAAALRGQVAIACAKQAYACFERIFGSRSFRRLASRGARVQRLLWASTSAKDPSYSDVKYVEPLIGPRTVSTMPLATLEAYDDHGRPQARLTDGLDRAERVLRNAESLGISLEQAGLELEDQGVAKFVEPFEELLKTIEHRRSSALSEATRPQA
jgi:transaldolase